MARPKQFDRDEALEAAQAVFWQKGYDATSTDDLRHAMGIGRQSLYDSFGGKRPLYLEVLQRYNAQSVAGLLARLHAAASPLAGISELLLTFANETAQQQALGCMGVAAICTFGSTDPDVSTIGNASAAVLQSALEDVLRKARQAGEARASLDERAAAHFLQSTVLGMKVIAKAGATRQTLRDIALTALQALTA
jgi:AcrR family transcriptional regulator